jgi:hypothetical protein
MRLGGVASAAQGEHLPGDGEDEETDHHLPRKAERGAGLQRLDGLAGDRVVLLHQGV